ncbi:MAG: hypothetical protein ACI8WB_004140 [Phenylobacterium sp.]|jgi:hypothetical protein
MLDFSLNDNPKITRLSIGYEQTPLLIIDDFANSPQSLITLAGNGSSFTADDDNFYPGSRKPAPEQYCQQLSALFLHQGLNKAFSNAAINQAKTLAAALAISDLPVDQLRPIQMLPHFDTCDNAQFAVVHYLCDQQHGGTGFYRHRNTGFERITQPRLASYASQLKQQALASQLHKNPAYINGSNALFEQIHSVDARMNRAIIYPSNLLHSGNINPASGLGSDPQQGRLTLGSFVVVR